MGKFMMNIRKKKHPTISREKKKAWDLYSEYIRLRDCLRTTRTLEYAHCVTCGKRYHYKQLQAGHFLPGRHNSVLFDERNCHAQCYGCNVPQKGNTVKYFRFMQKHYGEGVILELENKDRETKQFKVFELQDLQEIFKEKITKLRNQG
jgi:hypothetical protein